MVELKSIKKYFPLNGVMALDNASLSLHPGEIHALLGDNGTGKSTLMHILAGYFPPTSGIILVDGKERHFSSTAEALSLGIGMVRQHPGFIRGFKVWEDCVLGAEKSRSLFFNPVILRKRVLELNEKLAFNIPLDVKTEFLSVSQRQKAAVLALLLRNVKWFIFDEPAAVLTQSETKNLYDLFLRLRGEGCGIILITHKINEALAIADRVTVIRRGITEEYSQDGSFQKSAEINSGSLLNTKTSSEKIPILEIKNLQIEMPHLPVMRNINICLEPGKILGITGVQDSGLEALEFAVTGLLRQQAAGAGKKAANYSIAGSIILNGSDITGKGVRAFRDAGGAYLGADRLGSFHASGLPIRESLMIHAFRREAYRLFGLLKMRRINSFCREIMEKAGIARSIMDNVSSFSGGMIQRILLAREFAEEPLLLVLAEAGSALDKKNRESLMKELKELAGRGASALLFSTDAEELVSLADEILLLKNGTLTVASREELDDHKIQGRTGGL